MIRVGIDPGLSGKGSPTGVAALTGSHGVFTVYETAVLQAVGSWHERMEQLWIEMERTLHSYGDEVVYVAVEMPHHQKNNQTTIQLALLVGGYMRVAQSLGLCVIQVQPTQAKLQLTGYYQADKEHMIRSAAMQFGVQCTEHEADAIGIALAAEALVKGMRGQNE